jgi:hypothetical protein
METRELTGGEAIVQGVLAYDIDTRGSGAGHPQRLCRFADRDYFTMIERGSDDDPWKFIHPTFS